MLILFNAVTSSTSDTKWSVSSQCLILRTHWPKISLYQTSGQSADLVLVFSTVIYYHIIYRGIPEAYPIPPVNYSASISNRYESLQKKFTMQKKVISFLAEEKNSWTISVPGSICFCHGSVTFTGICCNTSPLIIYLTRWLQYLWHLYVFISLRSLLLYACSRQPKIVHCQSFYDVLCTSI